MSKVSKKILDKVKKVGRKPKWYFVAKRAFIWGSLVAAVLLTAFAISMILHQLLVVDWDVLPKMKPGAGMVPPHFRVLPYFWMLIAVLLFVFVYFDFKQTRKGHRYSGAVVIGGGVLIALVLGVGSCFVGASERADDFLHEFGPYKKLHYDREGMWVMPERGLLAGEVIEVQGVEIIILEDFSRDVWRVDRSGADVRGGRDIVEGIRLKMIGEMLKKGEFRADEIRFFRFR